MQPGGTAAAAPGEKVFDVGIDERLSYDQLLIVGPQNIFGMTGMFVFPGTLGRSFNLPPEQIAYLYGMTFLICGFVTILQSALLLRLPIIQGPYAGSFASLLAVGHLGGGLGAAYGSFFVAALIWCVLSLPVRGFSVIGLLARFLRAPIIAGMIVIFIMIQVSNVALPGWIGLPQSPGDDKNGIDGEAKRKEPGRHQERSIGDGRKRDGPERGVADRTRGEPEQNCGAVDFAAPQADCNQHARRDVHLAGGAGADAASGQAVRHPAGDFRQFDVDRAACAALRHAAEGNLNAARMSEACRQEPNRSCFLRVDRRPDAARRRWHFDVLDPELL